MGPHLVLICYLGYRDPLLRSPLGAPQWLSAQGSQLWRWSRSERLTTTFRPLLRAEFAHLLPGVTKNEEEEDVSAGGHQLTRTTNVTWVVQIRVNSLINGALTGRPVCHVSVVKALYPSDVSSLYKGVVSVAASALLLFPYFSKVETFSPNLKKRKRKKTFQTVELISDWRCFNNKTHAPRAPHLSSHHHYLRHHYGCYYNHHFRHQHNDQQQPTHKNQVKKPHIVWM